VKAINQNNIKFKSQLAKAIAEQNIDMNSEAAFKIKDVIDQHIAPQEAKSKGKKVFAKMTAKER
jgi:hypothetical protein